MRVRTRAALPALVAFIAAGLTSAPSWADDLPYYKVNLSTKNPLTGKWNRMQIRALIPPGVPNSQLPSIAEKLAKQYARERFLVGFFDTREAVDRFQGSEITPSLVERKAWRCNVRVNRGRSDGTCKSWGSTDISKRDISGAELFEEIGGTW